MNEHAYTYTATFEVTGKVLASDEDEARDIAADDAWETLRDGGPRVVWDCYVQETTS